MIRALGLSAMLALGAAASSAQGVTIAPHAVFIDHRTRSGSVLLYNPGTEPVEVEISTLFGYIVTDSIGATKLRTIDAPDSTQPSALAWIQAFPRRLTVQPRQRQTVRLLATPPAGLADGEYWVRLVIAAQAGSVPVRGADATTIQVGLKLQVRTIIGVNYRKGPVTTALTLSNLRAQLRGDSLITSARLERGGNAAFIGTIRMTLVDARGNAVPFVARDSLPNTYRYPIGVYFTMEPRIAVPVAARRVPRGRYWLRYEAVTEREDLDPAVVLKAPAARDSIEVLVP